MAILEFTKLSPMEMVQSYFRTSDVLYDKASIKSGLSGMKTTKSYKQACRLTQARTPAPSSSRPPTGDPHPPPSTPPPPACCFWERVCGCSLGAWLQRRRGSRERSRLWTSNYPERQSQGHPVIPFKIIIKCRWYWSFDVQAVESKCSLISPVLFLSVWNVI